MNRVREHIESLSIPDIEELVKEWEQFEKDGFIGDCLLRKHAEYLIESCGHQKHMITIWMRDIAFECYRKLSIEYKDSWESQKVW